MREDWRFGNHVQSFDLPRRGYVQFLKKNINNGQWDKYENEPWGGVGYDDENRCHFKHAIHEIIHLEWNGLVSVMPMTLPLDFIFMLQNTSGAEAARVNRSRTNFD